ncbi:hypothetical protein ABTX62_10860 [Streptomyces sp. NPDC096046]|uniref:hypothetical protein n=1 Tax=Streptomyces sp. NPDC096046 TaxID=3155542 RepID=UPI00332BA0BF
MRSARAVVALTAALSAAGAATASAGDGQGYRDDHHVVCSPYFGELEAETAGIEWGGAVCHNGPFDI